MSRPMVKLRDLKTPLYEAEVVQVFDHEGNFSALYDSEVDKSIRKIQIQPIEAGYNLRFTDTFGLKKLPVLPLSNIIDIKIVWDTKGLFKRKDRMAEITFLGNDRKLFIAKINFDDKYIDEIFNSIQKLKQLESDTAYWTRELIMVQMPNLESKTVTVYIPTPYLANGEEIIWHNLRTEDSGGERKTVQIDAITNYRIFQYDYVIHVGYAIMLPKIERVEPMNTKKTFRKNSFGNYSLSSTIFLTKIHEKVKANKVGDIIFFINDKPYITFRQVTDPDTLSTAVMSLNRTPIKGSVYHETIPIERSNSIQNEIKKGENKRFEAGLLPVNDPLKDSERSPYSGEWKNRDKALPQQEQNKTSNVSLNLNPTKIRIDWSNIIGYEEIKHIIDAVLINKNLKKTHVLIAGHAGTSKTVFLKTIESSLLTQGYNVHYLDATTLRSSGVVEYMFTNDVTYCLLDELDKLDKEHQSVFLNLLETGILQETKFKRIRKKEMKDTIVIATGNYIEKIMPPLLTRFLTLNIPKYTKDQFYDISIRLLTSQYGKTSDIAYYIADQIWHIYTEKRNEEPNMRQCVQIASLTDNTKESIDPILHGIATYSYKIEE
jgi:AAA domain (dynein-related subfamily)